MTELLAFYRWLDDKALPPLLQAYWHLLMYCNNKAAVCDPAKRWYWPVEFGVPNGLVMRYLGLKDRHQVKRARGRLMAAGLIHYYAPGKGSVEEPTKRPVMAPCGKLAGKYELIPFDKGLQRLCITTQEGRERPLVWSQKDPLSALETAPYINGINHKQTSLSHRYPKYSALNAVEPFHILPELTADEKRQIEKDFPDKIERFWEGMRLRDQKAMDGDGERE